MFGNCDFRDALFLFVFCIFKNCNLPVAFFYLYLRSDAKIRKGSNQKRVLIGLKSGRCPGAAFLLDSNCAQLRCARKVRHAKCQKHAPNCHTHIPKGECWHVELAGAASSVRCTSAARARFGAAKSFLTALPLFLS